MGGTETQASWPAPPSPPPTHPAAPPPPSLRAPRREPGRGRRQGREERGREGEEGARLGGMLGGWGGRKRKKIFSVSPPAESVCGLGENVSDILGRSRGRAGSERPRDRPSLESVPPPEPPITESPCHCDALSPRPPDAGTSGLGGLPSPSLPLQVSQAGKQARPPRTPGSSGEVGRGRGRREPRRLSSPPRWSGYPQGWRGTSCPDLGVSPDVGREWGRF